MKAIQVGDTAQLLELPDWLIHDLLEDEQAETRSFVGQCAVIEGINAYGYFWISFGITEEDGDGARYGGHSFGVPGTCLRLTDRKEEK
ncbi:MAG: hypothetical protein LBF93_01890 [Zoogloeaceae bacterium]|jgi:hypothetical protein|nr:hypothetical protein [Zoogloeaceae bacterium]